MGLDVSHGCWSGAYSAFARWRNQIAEAAGFAVADIRYEGGYTAPTILIDWGHVTWENLMGEWNETPSDPLIVLIAHSDCDGVIHPREASLLADRLEGLIPELPDEYVPGHIGNWREKTQRFVDGLRAAAGKGEYVQFG